MARPAAPPAMARPAAPAFRAAPPPQRPAMAPHVAPRIAAPLRPAAPRIVAPRPEIHRAAPPTATGHVGTRPEPRIAAPSRPGRIAHGGRATVAKGTGRNAYASQREQRIQQRQQTSAGAAARQPFAPERQSARPASIACSSACSGCNRKSRKAGGRNGRRKGAADADPPVPARAALQQPSRRGQERLASAPTAERRSSRAQAAARGRFPRSFRNNDAPQARAALTARENSSAPAPRLARAAIAQSSWPGSAPCSGPTPIPTSSVTPSGPPAYDPGYWAYAYDDFVDTVFWGADTPYSAYARYPEPGAAITDSPRARTPRA